MLTLQKKIYFVVMIGLIALCAGILVSHYYFRKNSIPETTASTVFVPPQAIADFSLIDTKGRPFTNDNFWGQWTFVFFGFTRCTQICPPAMSNLNKVYQLLLQQQQNPMPQVLLVSVDPENDTPQKLGQYVQSFNPHFQGATGDKAQIDKLAASLNVLYIKTQQDTSPNNTMIDHSGAILLINPNGRLAAVFSQPHDPEKIARDFQRIQAHSD